MEILVHVECLHTTCDFRRAMVWSFWRSFAALEALGYFLLRVQWIQVILRVSQLLCAAFSICSKFHQVSETPKLSFILMHKDRHHLQQVHLLLSRKLPTSPGFCPLFLPTLWCLSWSCPTEPGSEACTVLGDGRLQAPSTHWCKSITRQRMKACALGMQ